MIHIIRQQYLHVEVNGVESDGLALQGRLSDIYQHWLMPALEQILDRLAPSNEHLYIERLEINAGTLSLERLEQELTETVVSALEKLLPDPSMKGELLPALVSGKVQRKTERQSLHEAFVYFLKTGSLPWSFRLPADSSLEQLLLSFWEETTKADANLRSIDDTVVQALTATNVRQRLMRQFSPVFIETFISRYSPEGKKAMEAIVQSLRSSDVPPVAVKRFEKQLRETALALIATGKAITEQPLVSETWRTLPVSAVPQAALASWLNHHWPGVTADVAMFMPAKIPGAPEPASSTAGRESSRGAAPEKQQTEHHSAKTDRTISPAPQSTAPQPPAVKTPATLPMSPAEEKEKPSKEVPETYFIEHPEAEEGIYIENAGLVLLHPFLPQFFTALEIAAENNLLQPDRALCLLHFLAAGRSFAPEYELILPKILCNIPLATPVESDIVLTDMEKEEATALLEAVIRHWEVLQNTSPDELRGTFFLRSGKVSLRNDGDWLLQVETKAFDILLDHLPWGISMIKLPWMPRILWVEWR
jgi:hypothetical protein